MTVLRPRRARFDWRWIVDSPIVVATWASVVMCLLAIVQVARSLRDADRVRARSGQVLARIAAEDAAARLADAHAGPVPDVVTVGGVAVRVEAFGDQWLLTSELGCGESWQFVCPRLPGASPSAFGRSQTAVEPAAAAGEGLPPLDPAQLACAWWADQVPAFRRDVGIALLHLPAGTERDDFVIDPKRPRLGLHGEAELVQVPGHLWIEPGSRPLRLSLQRDLTLVVHGNLYIGRSIEIDGPGRLVMVACASPEARGFVDRDGDGRWSPGEPTCDEQPFSGAAEGGGNAFLGLASAVEPLSLAAGLVVHGEIHLSRTVRVEGPVVWNHGVTRLGGSAPDLVTTGTRLFVAERECVPGFLVAGRSRPGLLRPVQANRADDEEPLYLATPGR